MKTEMSYSKQTKVENKVKGGLNASDNDLYISTLMSYYNEVRGSHHLSHQEEAELAREMKKGGKRAKRLRDRLFNNNALFVIKIAKEIYHNHGDNCGIVQLQDLIEEGNMGLLEAIDNFDPENGAALTTYAKDYIRRNINQSIQKYKSAVYVPLSMHIQMNKVKKAKNMAEQRGDVDFNIEEYCAQEHINARSYHCSVEAWNSDMSLDMTIDEDGKSTLGDVIASSSWADEGLLHEEIKWIADYMLEKELNPKQRQMFRLRSGLETGEKMTCEAVGDIIGKNDETIRVACKKVETKLKHVPYANVVMESLAS